MPASFKYARRWLVSATAAAIVGLVAMPGVGHAENIEICINNSNGKIKGIDLGIDGCGANQTELDWVTTGPQGFQGPTGVQGNPGIAGAQGAPGALGLPGPPGAQGPFGPNGPEGDAGATGPTGPAGVMGNNGVRGPTGLVGPTGATGPSGTPGIFEPNISVFTGGTMGTLGAMNNVNLSGHNTVGVTVLVMGPGNGSDTSPATEVIMSEAGTAERLFVNADADPGTQNTVGMPSVFSFFLCNGNSYPGGCGLACVMVGPETTCSDLADTQTFAKGDFMSLMAYASYPGANPADIKWSVTYDHGAAILVP